MSSLILAQYICLEVLPQSKPVVVAVIFFQFVLSDHQRTLFIIYLADATSK